MAVLGFFGNLSMGFINRLDQKTQTIAQGSFDRSPLQAEWNPSRLNCPNESCLIGVKNKKKPKYALIGNSHADHLAHSLNRELISRGLTAYTFAFNGCQPVDFDEKSSHFTNNECFEKILKFLNEEKQVKTIIVSFRWTSAITGIGFGDENKKPVTNLDLNIIQERGSIIARKIEELVGDYRNLLLVYPIPEPGKDVPNYIAKYRMLKDKNFELTIPVDVFQRRNIATYTALDSISSPSRIVRIYPSKVFCDENSNGICRTVIKGKSLYFDDNHLSTFGASLIAPVITAELPIR